MERMPIKSENLLAIDYDPQQKVITVTFKGGVIYLYYDVPEKVYRALITAESKGIYFSEHIRDQYACEQIT
jgi:hypothetical protein